MRLQIKNLNHYEFNAAGVLCIDCKDVFDGHHELYELYEHRHLLALTLFSLLPNSWKSQHDEHGMSLGKNWFLIGTTLDNLNMISYHVPMRLWNDALLPIVKKAPRFDQHSSLDTLARLKTFLRKNA